MELTTLFGFAIISLFLYGILRQYNPNYAILLSCVCCVFLVVYAVGTLEPVFNLVQNLSQHTSFEGVSIIFKAVGIAVLTQFTQELCRESGQTALASSVEFVGKVAVIIISVPLLVSLSDIILELLQ